MDTPFIYLKLTIVLLTALAVSIFSWKVANFFIARKQFYIKSRWEIFLKKLGWCMFWFMFTIFLGIKIINVQNKNNKSLDNKNIKHVFLNR